MDYKGLGSICSPIPYKVVGNDPFNYRAAPCMFVEASRTALMEFAALPLNILALAAYVAQNSAR